MKHRLTARDVAFRCFCIGMLAASGLVHAGKPSLSEASEGRRADDRSLPIAARFEQLDRAYDELVAPQLMDPGVLSASELATAFEMTDLLAFYAQHGAQARLDYYVDVSTRLLDALENQDALTARQAEAVFGALVAMRDFESANRLKERFPDFLDEQVVPRVVFEPNFDVGLPGVLQLRDDGSLLARNVERRGDHVVAVIGCRQAQLAVEAIDGSAELRVALSRIPTHWLIPAERMNDPAYLREWNARFPNQRAAFVYANAAWRGVDFSAMPAFQRFEGERLLANMKGYGRNSGEATLLDVLDPD